MGDPGARPEAELDHPLRILVVDDDLGVLTSMRRLLASMGYAVTEARNAAEGLSKLEAQDVAVIDLKLPDQPGVVVVREIRRRGSATRVAVWTGSTDERLLAEAAAAVGADAVFHKPSDLEKLVAWVSRAPSGGDVAGQ
jgi:CheY-like chemotaxis protein